MAKIQKLWEGLGVQIVPESSSDTIESLDKDLVKRLFDNEFVIMFRDFGVTKEGFRQFSAKFTKSFFQTGFKWRKSDADDPSMAETVEGYEHVTLHSEMSYLPLAPSILWLFCQSPAQMGGRTIIADGAQVAKMLTKPTYDLFKTRKLKWVHKHPRELWSKFFQTDNIDEAKKKILSYPHMRIMESEIGGDQIWFEYYTSAFRKNTRGEEAFINNILPSIHMNKAADKSEFVSRVLLEDGAEIPQSVIVELMSVAQETAHYVEWKKGDVVMVNNHSVLHGRTRLGENDTRQIFVRFGEVA